MFTIGTAGHVDHGKSTLVKALTGIDPDRLPEEKAREMTIELGFAWMTLPGGVDVSIVDVPGHERFIRNMLAGVGGIDLALLVIAADEGVMPQTREHLAILDLLGVGHGVIVLTKCDLVDEDWLSLVTDDVRQTLLPTVLKDAPVCVVSAATGQGLDDLRTEIARALETVPPKPDLGRPRLPVDRVFTLTGFGTVVTGTLLDGSFSVGDEVEILPEGRRARIRGLQTHRHKVATATPGSRTALNLSGLAVDEVQRGDVIARPDQLRRSSALDVRLQLLAEAPRPLKGNDEVDFFSGASEVLARATPLEGREIAPGDSGWVRLRLARPLAVVPADRFILRLASPSVTLGGGRIADVNPRLHHRFRAQSLSWLRALDEGSPDQILLTAARSDRPVGVAMLMGRCGLAADQAQAALARLLETAQLVELDGALLTATAWTAVAARIRTELEDYHRRFPLRPGIPRDELRSRIGWAAKPFNAAVNRWMAEGVMAAQGALVAAARFEIRLPPEAEGRARQALARLTETPFAPPPENELGLSPDEVSLLIARGAVVRVGPNLVFERSSYDDMVRRTLAQLHTSGKITLAEVRDLLGTSRKYAQPLLEHLDEQKITRRVGDDHVLNAARQPG